MHGVYHVLLYLLQIFLHRIEVPGLDPFRFGQNVFQNRDLQSKLTIRIEKTDSDICRRCRIRFNKFSCLDEQLGKFRDCLGMRVNRFITHGNHAARVVRPEFA